MVGLLALLVACAVVGFLRIMAASQRRDEQRKVAILIQPRPQPQLSYADMVKIYRVKVADVAYRRLIEEYGPTNYVLFQTLLTESMDEGYLADYINPIVIPQNIWNQLSQEVDEEGTLFSVVLNSLRFKTTLEWTGSGDELQVRMKK